MFKALHFGVKSKNYISFKRTSMISSLRSFSKNNSLLPIASLLRQEYPLNVSRSSYLVNLNTLRSYSTAPEQDVSNQKQDKQSEKDDKQSREQGKHPLQFSLRTRIIIGVLGVSSIVGYMFYLERLKQRMKARERMKQLKVVGFGGDWALVNAHTGQRCNNDDFKDKWLIIYFGFTNCPDICPDELEKVLKVVDKIDNDAKLPNITPIFVTIDPARDDCAQVKKYCEEFSPKLIGLTGNAEEIQRVAGAYRVYMNVHEPDKDGEYLVDHSIIHYLVNPRQEFVDYYQRSVPEDKVFESIKRHMTENI